MVGAAPVCPPVSPCKGASIVSRCASCAMHKHFYAWKSLLCGWGMCLLRMETPLRGRSGGHTGTAPTISRMAPCPKVAGEQFADGQKREMVAGEVLADGQKQGKVAGRGSPTDKNKRRLPEEAPPTTKTRKGCRKRLCRWTKIRKGCWRIVRRWTNTRNVWRRIVRRRTHSKKGWRRGLERRHNALVPTWGLIIF